jgi:toxin YoeB
MNKTWSGEAWDDCLYWQSQDKKALKRIKALTKAYAN